MILFCMDTSGPVAGVALIQDSAVRYEGMAVNAFTHSQSILPMAEEAYRRAGLEIGDTDYFAVTVGPGSFTGVRIGVSTVKALAHATAKPCIAVDALEAMAAGAQPFSGVICPIQDARAGQVYGAAFRNGERLMPDEPLKLEDYLEKILTMGDRFLFLGDGMPVHREKILETLGEKAIFAPAHLCYLRPSAAGVLAIRSETRTDYLNLQATYLRPPNAQKNKKLLEAMGMEQA